MSSLVKKGFDINNIISFGNMFLIGNGHIGYRGTLEEYSNDQLVGFNIVGEYDKYKDKWRESINMPNPFCVQINNYNILKDKPVYHEQKLDLTKAIVYRKTIYDNLEIKSEKFIPYGNEDIILMKYQIKALNDLTLNASIKMDSNIYEINGPHFKKTNYKANKNSFSFHGLTNENKDYYEKVVYKINTKYELIDNALIINKEIKENEIVTVYSLAKLSKLIIYKLNINSKIYNNLKKAHIDDFKNKWEMASITIKGNKKANFAMEYSIYHLLILGNEYYQTSIPARGVSGETYKGAIFWDTEIFLMPFYTLTFPNIAKNLLRYRINTLSGAKLKAKEFNYEGAFYAWESQETGLEACSKYNITDWKTNKPIRTYFNEKQIHISSDIAYALLQYINVTNDYSILDEGGLEVLVEIAKFNMSYATLENNKYHFNDVIGPDEYHERVNDNAFTTYMAYFTLKETLELLINRNYDSTFIKKIEEFLNKMYLPPINNEGLLEQFSGYFNLEDTTVDVVRSRLVNPRQYWGGKDGPASTTRIIKQADVITLYVLGNNYFDYDSMKANFDFYYPYTEHGSSLSSSMYSIIASNIGYKDIAYKMFIKSASIDLGTDQKMFAGGIYIGGTHPASNGGAYLSLIYGMAGLKFNESGFTLNPCLPKQIKGLEFKLNYKNKIYKIVIDKNNCYRIGG